MSLDQVPHQVDIHYPAESEPVYERLRHAALFHDVLNLRERPVLPGRAPLAITRAFSLEARPLSHSVPTFGYRLAEPDGRRMLPERLAALGITGPDIGRLKRAGRLVAGGRRVTSPR